MRHQAPPATLTGWGGGVRAGLSWSRQHSFRLCLGLLGQRHTLMCSGTRELIGIPPRERCKAPDGTLTCKEWADVNNILHLYAFSPPKDFENQTVPKLWKPNLC